MPGAGITAGRCSPNRADLPGGEQVGDERERRREAQRDGAASPQPRVSQGAVALRHQPAELTPADRGPKVQAHVIRGASRQHLVNPFGLKLRIGAPGHLREKTRHPALPFSPAHALSRGPALETGCICRATRKGNCQDIRQ
jgi:hypothetical protein